MIYPWQNTQWQLIQTQRLQQRLPHAILFSGTDGLGKSEFATSLAVSLLCSSPQANGEPCASCPSCLLVRAGTHPDLIQLSPEDDTKAIKVDDVRDLCKAFCLTSQYSGYKVAIIDSADNMNINAANSLLKTLEEPNDQTVLILVSSRPHRLPVTIRSRCQTVFFTTPDRQQASSWLADRISGDTTQLLNMSQGAPLKALQYSENELLERRQTLISALLSVSRQQAVTDHAQKLAKWPEHVLLGWLYDWISDLLKLLQCGEGCVLINQDYRSELLELSHKVQPDPLYHYLDQVIKLRKVQSIPLNIQMLWEDLLISWEQLLKRA